MRDVKARHDLVSVLYSRLLSLTHPTQTPCGSQTHRVLSRAFANTLASLTCVAEIGVALTTFGGLFMLLGIMLFFDGALLALGNVRDCVNQTDGGRLTFPQLLFLSGLTLIIGPQKTFYFFARKQKLRGTVCFIGGILLVFFKWPFVGVLVETFGFLNLFGYVYPALCQVRLANRVVRPT